MRALTVVVIADSGGIQEEATCLGVPCVTVRENTERRVTVEHATNVIAGAAKAGIEAAIRHQLQRKTAGTMPAKWDGQTAGRIMDILIDAYGRREASKLVTAGANDRL